MSADTMSPATVAHAILWLRIIIGALAFAVFCGLCIIVPELRRRWIIRREEREFARSLADAQAVEARRDARRKADAEKWGFATPFSYVETRRVPTSTGDSVRGQFSAGRESWDTPGVHR